MATRSSFGHFHSVVVVIGDLGRSPRMQYHAMSLAAIHGNYVSLVGLEGEPCVDGVVKNSHIREYRLSSGPFSKLSGYLYYLLLPLKLFFLLIQLLWVLLTIRTPHVIFVQNPPSFPALPICWLCARMRQSRLIVDWHNFGFSILGLSLGTKNPLVILYRWIERLFGGMADSNMCVSESMKLWLKGEWGIDATVVYDRPPDFFKVVNVADMHNLMMKLKDTIVLQDQRLNKWFTESNTLTTRATKDHSSLRNDRPAIIISSTSWTPDEDLFLLLEAAQHIQKSFVKLPPLIFAITGKGPMREKFESSVKDLHLENIFFVTLWLNPEDYPTFLSCADLGVSLHRSSSSLDLPMKIVDMFGSKLPVCAIEYSTIHELVVDGFNGFVFRDSIQLANYIVSLFEDFPKSKKLMEFKKNLEDFPTWETNWIATAKPLVKKTFEKRSSLSQQLFASIFRKIFLILCLVLLYWIFGGFRSKNKHILNKAEFEQIKKMYFSDSE